MSLGLLPISGGKNRMFHLKVTPLQRMATVRSELCGIENVHTWGNAFEFYEEYFIVDSQIIHAMMQKDFFVTADTGANGSQPFILGGK